MDAAQNTNQRSVIGLVQELVRHIWLTAHTSYRQSLPQTLFIGQGSLDVKALINSTGGTSSFNGPAQLLTRKLFSSSPAYLCLMDDLKGNEVWQCKVHHELCACEETLMVIAGIGVASLTLQAGIVMDLSSVHTSIAPAADPWSSPPNSSVLFAVSIIQKRSWEKNWLAV